jgi:iron complex transport system substrate-binding protein
VTTRRSGREIPEEVLMITVPRTARGFAVAAVVVPVAVLGAVPGAGAAKKRRAFPAHVKAANGRVTIPHRPRRIVVLSPTATETLSAIGARRQLIAVDDQSNYPRGVPRTKLSSYRPNAEAVARYRPDLVVTSTAANKLLPALRKLHIPVLLEPAATTIGGAYAQMRQLGTATGHPRAAAALIARMKRRIDRAVRSVPKGRALSFFHELSPDYYSVTSKTFVGRVYRLFGLRNIADAARKADAYPQLSGEYVLAANPDLIVLADTKCCHQSAATVRKRPGWSEISAVHNGRVVALNDDIPSRWGPRIADFVERIAAVVRRARA